MVGNASARCRIQPGELEFFTSHTNPSAATSARKRGTGFQSTDGGRLGTLLPCRKCSIRSRRCRTTCLPCAATSRRAGSGFGGRMDRGSCRDGVLGRLLWARGTCANIIAHVFPVTFARREVGAVLDTFWIHFLQNFACIRANLGSLWLRLRQSATLRKHWLKPRFRLFYWDFSDRWATSPALSSPQDGSPEQKLFPTLFSAGIVKGHFQEMIRNGDGNRPTRS